MLIPIHRLLKQNMSTHIIKARSPRTTPPIDMGVDGVSDLVAIPLSWKRFNLFFRLSCSSREGVTGIYIGSFFCLNNIDQFLGSFTERTNELTHFFFFSRLDSGISQALFDQILSGAETPSQNKDQPLCSSFYLGKSISLQSVVRI